MTTRTVCKISLTLGLCGLVALAVAQQAMTIPKVSLDLGGAKGTNEVSTSLQILAMLTILSLAPSILILTTAFTRIVIIFSFLRSALGTPTIPPNQVVVGLSLFLTFFVMEPTYKQINETAIQPLRAGSIQFPQALTNAQVPIRSFMLKSTYKQDLTLFLNLRKEQPKTPNDLSLVTLIPAFIISELKTSFMIGFYIFIPFLVIDLIVASSLMSMGMMMLPPTIISLPAKLLVFVLADGWGTLISAILAGYR